jgi:hypothetical protein
MILEVILLEHICLQGFNITILKVKNGTRLHSLDIDNVNMPNMDFENNKTCLDIKDDILNLMTLFLC